MVVSDSDQLGRVYPDNPTVFHRLECWLALGVRFGTVSDELVVHSSSLQRATTVLMRAFVGNFLLRVLPFAWRGRGYDTMQYITVTVKVRRPSLPLRSEKENASRCEHGGCPRRLADRKE